MKKLNNYLKEIGLGWLFKLSVVASILLLIAGLMIPPLGVIDGSILIGVAEILIGVNIPIFLAFAADHKVKASYDIDDKKIQVETDKK